MNSSSAFKRLVEKDCGNANPLVSIANQIVQDASGNAFLQGKPQAENFTEEYLRYCASQQLAPTTFAMSSLLESLNQLETNTALLEAQRSIGNAATSKASISPGQAVISDDANWSEEYFQSRMQVPAYQRGQQQMPGGDSILHDAWQESTLLPTAADFLSMDEAWNEAQQTTTTQQNVPDLKWSTEYLDDFERSAALQSSVVESPEALWQSEYERFVEEGKQAGIEQHTDDFWDRLEADWNLAAKRNQVDWLDDYEEFRQRYVDYKFSEENPFMDVDDALEQGKQLLASGDLANAILMFESAVQTNPTNSEAWQFLGHAQAENEQEPSAIAALRKCIELQPACLNALMLLAVSYTNESLYSDALDALKRWLEVNGKYADVMSSFAATGLRRISSAVDPITFREVEDLLIGCVQHSLPNIDAEVQNALGVLYNMTGDYDRAVDCLRAAVECAPDNARLWNRLGATLANSNRSSDAIAAYDKALTLYPGFVRARYNLGISCLNLKAHREAVEHFLCSLNLQQRGIGPTAYAGNSDGPPTWPEISSTIWSALRLAISQLSRPLNDTQHLYSLIDAHNLAGLAQEFGVIETMRINIKKTPPPSRISPYPSGRSSRASQSSAHFRENIPSKRLNKKHSSNVLMRLRYRETNNFQLYRHNRATMAALVASPTRVFVKQKTFISSKRIGYENERLYFNDYSDVISIVTNEQLYHLGESPCAKLAPGEKVETALLWQHAVQAPERQNSMFCGLTSLNRLCFMDLSSGALISTADLPEKYKFTDLEWNESGYSLSVSGKKRKTDRPSPPHSSTPSSSSSASESSSDTAEVNLPTMFCVFDIMPLRFCARFVVHQKVFGNFMKAQLSESMLLLTYKKNDVFKAFNLEAKLDKQRDLLATGPALPDLRNGDAGTISFYASDLPPKLTDLSFCFEHDVLIGGFPYHYLYVEHKKSEESRFRLTDVADDKLMIELNGWSTFDKDRHEMGYVKELNFHYDLSGRFVGINRDKMVILKIDASQRQLSEICRVSLFAANDDDDFEPMPTITRYGRVSISRQPRQCISRKSSVVDVDYEDELDFVVATIHHSGPRPRETRPFAVGASRIRQAANAKSISARRRNRSSGESDEDDDGLDSASDDHLEAVFIQNATGKILQRVILEDGCSSVGEVEVMADMDMLIHKDKVDNRYFWHVYRLTEMIEQEDTRWRERVCTSENVGSSVAELIVLGIHPFIIGGLKSSGMQVRFSAQEWSLGAYALLFCILTVSTNFLPLPNNGSSAVAAIAPGQNGERKAVGINKAAGPKKLEKLLKKKMRKLAKLHQEVNELRSQLQKHSLPGIEKLQNITHPAITSGNSTDLNVIQMHNLLTLLAASNNGNLLTAKKERKHWPLALVRQLRKLNKLLQQTDFIAITKQKQTPPLLPPVRGNNKKRRKHRNGIRKQTSSQHIPAANAGHDEQQNVAVMRRSKHPLRQGPHGSFAFPSEPAHSRRVISKPAGIAGAVCRSHQDCRPGLCCHEFKRPPQSSTLSPLKDGGSRISHSSPSSRSLLCANHSLLAAAKCAHSCQCHNGLSCFVKGTTSVPQLQSNFAIPIEKLNANLPLLFQSHLTDANGTCKIPSSDDVENGDYLNRSNTIFNSSKTLNANWRP